MNKYQIFSLIVCSVSLFCLSSCIPKKDTKKCFISSYDIPLYLQMPKNKLVFENVSSLVYDSLWNHFNRVGFTMVDRQDDSYCLRVLVKNLESVQKFLSPDLLTYAEKMNIELFCQLLDKQGVLLAKKAFSFSTLISKSKSYVLNSKFSDFEYRRLLELHVHKIDHYFRPFVLKSLS